MREKKHITVDRGLLITSDRDQRMEAKRRQSLAPLGNLDIRRESYTSYTSIRRESYISYRSLKL